MPVAYIPSTRDLYNDFIPYRWVENDSASFTPLTKPVSKIALMSSGGIMYRDQHALNDFRDRHHSVGQAAARGLCKFSARPSDRSARSTELQRRIVTNAMRAFETITTPATIGELPYVCERSIMGRDQLHQEMDAGAPVARRRRCARSKASEKFRRE
jgi:hypothetical protein